MPQKPPNTAGTLLSPGAAAVLRMCAHTLQDTLLMVGPYGDSLELPIQNGTVLVTECDSVRMLSGEQHELLRRVPDAQVDVFRIGSTAPGDCLGIRFWLYQSVVWLAVQCGSVRAMCFLQMRRADAPEPS